MVKTTPDEGEPGVRSRLFARGGFAANVSTLASGAAAAQAVTVLAAPVLTRLYGPAEFAAFALFGAAVSVLSVGASGRYDFAIMLAKRDEEAANVAGLALVLSLLTTSAVFAAALVFGDTVLARLGVSGEGGWVRFLPAGVLLMVWTSIGLRWQSRKKRFGTVALADASGAVCAASTQVGAGLLAESAGGALLICGRLAGLFVRVAILSWRMFADLFRLRPSLSAKRMRRAAGRYWQFPAFSVGSGLLSKAAHEVPVLLLVAFFEPQVVGFYALARRVLGLPMGLIGQAVGHVFFQRIAASRHDSISSRALLLATSRNLFLIVLLPMLVLLLWGPALFAFAFGEQWEEAGRYARLMVPMLAATFVVGPMGVSMQAFEKQHMMLFWFLASLALAVAAIGLGVCLDSVKVAIISYSLVGAGMRFALLLLMLHWAGRVGDGHSRHEAPDGSEDGVSFDSAS